MVVRRSHPCLRSHICGYGTVGFLPFDSDQQSFRNPNSSWRLSRKVVARRLCVLPLSNHWQCFNSTGTTLSIQIVFAIEFSSITSRWSCTSSSLRVPIVRAICLLSFANVCRFPARLDSGDRFTQKASELWRQIGNWSFVKSILLPF